LRSGHVRPGLRREDRRTEEEQETGRQATLMAAVWTAEKPLSPVQRNSSVPLQVTVDSPMSATDHVRAIHVFTEKNPQPNIIGAYLGPRAGRAVLATRARIADSGTVVAIAQMSDGSFWSESVQVVVTLSACLEDGLI